MAIINHTFAPCAVCGQRDGAGPALRTYRDLVEIGEEVTNEARSRTTYAYYQCKTCGVLWERTEDSGLGGHASFLNRITR